MNTMKTFIRIATFCVLTGSGFSAQSVDDATLSRYLRQNFVADESMGWEKIDSFKERFAVTDDQLHRVLMDIYRDAEGKRLTLTPKTPEWNNNNRRIEGVLGWLPKCGDIPVKEFLMSYATTKENDSWLRRSAILSSLRIADAEEAKNVLLRFLVEGDRMDSQARSSVCEHARMVFKAACAEKKEAILYSLLIALSREDNKWLFRVYDNVLCEISKDYASSQQRLAMLIRLINVPSLCKADEYAMPELQEKLKALQKIRLYTNVSTNLAAIKARNFNLPLLVGATNELMSVISDSQSAEFTKVGDDSKSQVFTLSILGCLAVIMLGFGVWKFTRK